MEPLSPPSPTQSNSSLHERTNHTRQTNTVFPNEEADGPAKAIAADLHRKQSFRHLSDRLYSSETSSSPPGYIYNAEVVSENTSPLMAPTNRGEAEPLPSLLETTALPTTPLSILSPIQLSPPHSGWPPTRLAPIIERSTRSRLHNSDSRPKLRSSPERRSNIIRPMLSVQSIRPAVSSSPIQPVDHKLLGNRFRSFSLNDLDCLPKSDTNRAWRSPGQRSSSSDDILRTLRACPIFPLKPTHSPPYRTPTPPGLPSFGTREAEEYRLTPSSPPSRAVALFQRWIGRPYDENDDRYSITSNPLSAPTSPVAPSSPTSPPMKMLQRVLGVTRLVEPPRQSDNPRSRLPARIRVASLPGALAQADDGTWVRGRWTSRASSHGVGTRPLDEHPMVRSAGLHSIDEMVREIDKAYEAVAEEDGSRQMRATQAILDDIAETSHHTILPVSPLPEPYQPLRTRGNIAGREPYSSVLENDWEASQRPFTPYLHDETFISNSSLRPPSNTDGGLSASNPVQQAASHRDRVTGIRESVEQEGRRYARRNIADQKENRRCSKDCWEAFWSFCCCRASSINDQAVA